MRLKIVAQVLLVILGTGCASSVTDPAQDELQSTTPTPTWGDLTVDVATNDGSGTDSSLSQTILPDDLLSLSLAGGELEITNVRMVFRDLRFHLKNRKHSTARFEGPFVANLVQDGQIKDETYPAIGKVNAVPGAYNQGRMRLASLKERNIPDELAGDALVTNRLVGNSVVVEGTFTETATNDIDQDGLVSDIPFLFVSDNGETIEIATTGSFAVVEAVDNYLFLTFRLQQWFAGSITSLQAIDPDDFALEDGYLILSDESSGDLSDIVSEIEDDIDRSFGFASSEDDIFDFSEDDLLASSAKDEDDFDDECFDGSEEDWDEDCLDSTQSCEDVCYETDCFDDDSFDWIRACITEQQQCILACWEEEADADLDFDTDDEDGDDESEDDDSDDDESEDDDEDESDHDGDGDDD